MEFPFLCRPNAKNNFLYFRGEKEEREKELKREGGESNICLGEFMKKGSWKSEDASQKWNFAILLLLTRKVRYNRIVDQIRLLFAFATKKKDDK